MGGIVDADVHSLLPSPARLKDFLPARRHDYLDQRPWRQIGTGGSLTRPMPSIYRDDAWPPGGGPPGSDLTMMRAQLLDQWPYHAAILNPLDTLGWPVQGHAAAELYAALNDADAELWLERDARLFASIAIPPEDAAAAAREIRRVAGQHRFVQVLTSVRTVEPFGARKYWPIYEAACEHDLPVAAHTGGRGGGGPASSGVGTPSYFFEFHCSWAYNFQAHVVSLIASGTFEAFPTLRFVLVEGGFSWMPALMWRLDRAWETVGDRSLRGDVPPSELVRRHFAFTTQPIDDVEAPEHFAQLLRQLDMDDRIFFASDYPHWDFDAPTRAFPPVVKGELKDKLISQSAYDFFGLARWDDAP